MKREITILRRERPDAAPFRQTILFTTENENATVAFALTKINEDPDIRDMEGKPVKTIAWESSCLQKKCGACAMRINGIPRLACDTFLKNFKKGKILLEPLRKFPVVKDLVVDRSVLYENLSKIQVWLEQESPAGDRNGQVAYEASRCLQCGCCLEVCPNFHVGGSFAGMASQVPVTRILAEDENAQKSETAKEYRKYVFEGCGKSLACRDICPAGIDMEKMLIHSNAIAVWKRHPFGKPVPAQTGKKQ